MIFIFLIIGAFRLCTSCPISYCIFETIVLPTMNIINRHEIPLETTAITYHVKQPETDKGCIVNTTEYLQNFNLTKESQNMIVFSLRCGRVHPIYFTEYGGEHYSNVIAYLQVRYCTLGLYDVQQLSRVANLIVYTMFQSILDPHKKPCLNYSQEISNCAGIDKMTSLSLFTPSNTTVTKLNDIFNCTDVFSKMTELSLTQQGLTEIPKDFQEKFPYLQTLEFEKNNLTVPPKFPWNDETQIMEYDLSRSVYFDAHYIVPYHMKVPNNIFKRYINLQYNNIVDLRNFEFQGHLDMISLKHNGLKYISDKTFTSVSRLQTLDISENYLTEIPNGAFHGLKDMKYLNVRQNVIEKLHKETFQDMAEMIKLDLSKNRLQELPDVIFTNLNKLEVLHLESNYLTTIRTGTLPVLSLKLKKLYFQSNPITVFPISVFYLRNLKLADLSYTKINLDNINSLLSNINYAYFGASVVNSATENNVNQENRGDDEKQLRKIDLSFSNVTRIGNVHQENGKKIELILRNFEIVLNNNDLLCDCRIIPFSNFVKEKLADGGFKGDEYFFKDWVCQKPTELKKRPIFDIREEETYCQVQVEFCPSICTCFQWSVSNITIVDCRNKNMSALPLLLPNGTLDLWFQYNNITELKNMEYFTRSRDIDFSHNVISRIDSNFVSSVTHSARKLHLNSNFIAYLPYSFADLSGVTIFIQDNPFICDCKTHWMKTWLLRSQNLISDWIDVACAYGNEEANQLISVDDDKFVCLEAFDTVKHVVAPSVASTICAVFFITLLAVCFLFRLELKVLLFIYFGFHPFDKDENDGDEEIDCVIVHAASLNHWVSENVVQPLEVVGNEYVVCEIARDFVVGFSFQENICSIVRHSKRMILILSEDFLVESDIVKIAWNEAQEKIQSMRTNYAIVVGHGITKNKIENKDLKRYIKRGRYITTDEKLFFEKILYLLPSSTKHHENRLPDLRTSILKMYENDEMDGEKIHAFLSYSDRDSNIALKTLTPALEELRYALLVPDRDFIPGASKEENILKAIDSCRHTIFILSGPYLQDEWSLFTFRAACEKSIRQKCNHLIIIVTDENQNDYYDEEVKHYLKTHVALHVTDKYFWQRLIKALPNDQNQKDNLEILNNQINDRLMRQQSVLSEDFIPLNAQISVLDEIQDHQHHNGDLVTEF